MRHFKSKQFAKYKPVIRDFSKAQSLIILRLEWETVIWSKFRLEFY